MDRSGLSRAAVLLALSASLFACGPVSTTLALSDAESAIESARAADARRYALYELTSAEEYFRKAREEEGYSDFQAALDLAETARGFADRARARALASPARGGGPTVPAAGHDEPPEDDDAPVGSQL
ncbi:DUF4398 domain-containing protein [Myxococcota bacterium]|nr:DUF4398 domain-containing protein [Myxococcota bacterium]